MTPSRSEATACIHLHSVYLADARRRLEQAIASLRQAAALDPRTARAVGGVHANLIDQLETLKEVP